MPRYEGRLYVQFDFKHEEPTQAQVREAFEQYADALCDLFCDAANGGCFTLSTGGALSYDHTEVEAVDE
jgi:hypothetical protein